MSPMKFKTGDIARLMGITNMGVLYLEKRGIIHSTRDANGYRVFDLDSISELALIRSYENLGFPLDQAVSLSHQEAPQIQEALQSKKEELLARLELISHFENFFHFSAVTEGELSPENAVFQDRPALYYCPLWEEVLDLEQFSAGERKKMQAVDISWISTMPLMRFCSKIVLKNDGEFSHIRGNCITVDDARKSQVVINEYVEYVPSAPCLRFLCSGIDFKEALAKARRYLAGYELKPDGTVFVAILSRSRGIGQKTSPLVSEYYVPFCRTDENSS